jgi:eukaryotic translation initiation factor 2C
LGTSISLETIRGYFYNVKPGTGNIIVNFNLATSAFFCPILVSEFLDDRKTFTLSVAEGLLKKLRVYIEYPRVVDDEQKTEFMNREASRLWSCHGLSEKPIGELKFRSKQRGADGKPVKDGHGEYIFTGPECSVIDHLQTGK